VVSHVIELAELQDLFVRADNLLHVLTSLVLTIGSGSFSLTILPFLLEVLEELLSSCFVVALALHPWMSLDLVHGCKASATTKQLDKSSSMDARQVQRRSN
jgi:hypothetical protein